MSDCAALLPKFVQIELVGQCNLRCAMRDLLADADTARRWGANARRYAEERFGIARFVKDWMKVFRTLTQ